MSVIDLISSQNQNIEHSEKCISFLYNSLSKLKTYTVKELTIKNSKKELIQICDCLNIRYNKSASITKSQLALLIHNKLNSSPSIINEISENYYTIIIRKIKHIFADYFKNPEFSLQRQQYSRDNVNKIKTNPTISVKPRLPSSIEERFRNIKEICQNQPPGWERRQKIGSGSAGVVYMICKLDNCNYVLKIQNIRTRIEKKAFANEVLALTELKDSGAVAKIETAWTCRDKGYIIMEKVRCSTIFKPIRQKIKNYERYKELKKLLDTIKKYGWLHIDLIHENVCETEDGRLVLIDFGRAVKKGKEYYTDHPFAHDYPNYRVTFEDLEIVQDYNLDYTFNLNYDRESIKKTKEKYDILLNRVYGSNKK